MKTAVLLTFFFFLLAGCKKDNDIASGIPACIKNEITANKNDPNWETGSVDEYLFQGELVYAFVADINIVTDGSTTVKNSSCTSMCTIGGFSGQMMCNGVHFYNNAQFKRNIWKK